MISIFQIWKRLNNRHGSTLIRNLAMDSFVTDTQALIKFMLGKKVINDKSHQAYKSADNAWSAHCRNCQTSWPTTYHQWSHNPKFRIRWSFGIKKNEFLHLLFCIQNGMLKTRKRPFSELFLSIIRQLAWFDPYSLWVKGQK